MQITDWLLHGSRQHAALDVHQLVVSSQAAARWPHSTPPMPGKLQGMSETLHLSL